MPARYEGMTTQDFLISAGLLLSVMAAASLIEYAVPLFASPAGMPGRRRGNLLMTAQALLTAFALGLGVAAAARAFPIESPRLLEAAGIPPWLRPAFGILALDFAFGYVAHRTQHAWPVLWRFHRVHHSDPFVDASTGFRTHPVEVGWRHLWLFGTVWMLGIPATAVVVFRTLSAVNAVFEHANVRVPRALDSALSWIWVTPNMHKIHHSRNRAETDTNFGNLLPIYDRMLGTFVPTPRAFDVRYGLDDAKPEDVRSLGAMLAMPWRTASGAGMGGRRPSSRAAASAGPIRAPRQNPGSIAESR